MAAFYSGLLQLPIVFEQGAYVVIGPVEPGTAHLIFQKVPEPAHGKVRAHLDLHVPDVEAATEYALANGGTRGDDVADVGLQWRTMRDPEGHVFCLQGLD